MSEVRAIVPFIYNHPSSGLISVGEGETANIDDAEAKRLEAAGILQIVSADVRHPKIETASVVVGEIETTGKRGKK